MDPETATNMIERDDRETTITFENFDKFNRREFASQITRVISTFYPFYNEAFVLSLNAKFGSGKSTFLKMWKNKLQLEGYQVVYLNAWETDFDDEPLLPIISSILDKIESSNKTTTKTLADSLKDVVGATALIGNQILRHKTGIDLLEGGQIVESEIKQRNTKKLGEVLYKEHTFKINAYRAIKIALSDYVETLEKKPFIILVDELDRARPDYAVRFLETIKHIFSVRGVCFVLAVDREQLKASVKQLYGQVDFENWYRRFTTREAHLETPNNGDWIPFIDDLSKEFFDQKRSLGVNFPFRKSEQGEIVEFIALISTACNLAPREIESLFRIFSQLMAVTEDKNQTALPGLIRGAVFIIAIFVKNRTLYHRLGKGQAKPKELFEFLQSLDYEVLLNKEDEAYIAEVALSFCLCSEKISEQSEIAEYLLKYDKHDLPEGEERNRRKQELIKLLARQLIQHGGLHSKSGYQIIYTAIEKWMPFIK